MSVNKYDIVCFTTDRETHYGVVVDDKFGITVDTAHRLFVQEEKDLELVPTDSPFYRILERKRDLLKAIHCAEEGIGFIYQSVDDLDDELAKEVAIRQRLASEDA